MDSRLFYLIDLTVNNPQFKKLTQYMILTILICHLQMDKTDRLGHQVGMVHCLGPSIIGPTRCTMLIRTFLPLYIWWRMEGVLISPSSANRKCPPILLRLYCITFDHNNTTFDKVIGNEFLTLHQYISLNGIW